MAILRSLLPVLAIIYAALVFLALAFANAQVLGDQRLRLEDAEYGTAALAPLLLFAPLPLLLRALKCSTRLGIVTIVVALLSYEVPPLLPGLGSFDDMRRVFVYGFPWLSAALLLAVWLLIAKWERRASPSL